MIGRNKHVDLGSLFFRGPEISASVSRLLRQDLKPIDLVAVELTVSVTGDSQQPLHSGAWNTRFSNVC